MRTLWGFFIFCLKGEVSGTKRKEHSVQEGEIEWRL